MRPPPTHTCSPRGTLEPPNRSLNQPPVNQELHPGNRGALFAQEESTGVIVSTLNSPGTLAPFVIKCAGDAAEGFEKTLTVWESLRF